MSPSAQLTCEQLNGIIEDDKNIDDGAREVQEQVEHGEEVLDPANTSSVLNTVVTTIINEFEHECLDEGVRLLNAHPTLQSTDDHVPGHKYSIPGMPATTFLPHQVRAIWFIMRRRVWDANMPGERVADEVGLGKTFTSVAVVLAMVPGYPAAVRVWNRTGWYISGCYPENRGTHRVRSRVRTGPWFHFTVPTPLARIQYLSSDRIMTSSVCKLCSISRAFNSRFQICDPTDIR